MGGKEDEALAMPLPSGSPCRHRAAPAETRASRERPGRRLLPQDEASVSGARRRGAVSATGGQLWSRAPWRPSWHWPRARSSRGSRAGLLGRYWGSPQSFQSLVSMWGVGPAVSTGKPDSAYWPGGSRAARSSETRRRPLKPREMNPATALLPTDSLQDDVRPSALERGARSARHRAYASMGPSWPTWFPRIELPQQRLKASRPQIWLPGSRRQ
jgi:hypothetical protein